MARQSSQADRVRAFATERRVFTRREIVQELGDAAAGALAQMSGVDLVRHAIGVYSVAGVRPDDPRVIAKIEEIQARPLTDDDIAKDAARAEERSAAAIGAKVRTKESVTERVQAHFEQHPVAGAPDLRREYGQNAAAAAKALADRGAITRVRDGLWVRNGITPFGSEMNAYVQMHSVELAQVKRELEEVRGARSALEDGTADIEWKVSRPKGRGAMVYMNMVGVPGIMAQARSGRVAWMSAKGVISPIAAEHIARMVLNPLPERLGELIDLVESGRAPTGQRRRHGLYRDYQRPEQEQEQEGPQQFDDRDEIPRSRGYTAHDTRVLDPRRLGNGLPEEVTLEIDDREADEIVTMLTDVPNLHIIRTHLEMADFVARIGNRILAIERKTSSDLCASLEDNRLAEQVHRMSGSGIPCCFVIEGGMTGVKAQPLPRLASMRTRLNFGMNMRVIETIDMADTAYTIVTAIRDCFFGTGTAFDLKPVKIPGIGSVERAMHMLQAIPGISPTRASALIQRFGSIAGVANATAKEIATIDGIGSKTAAALHEVLNAG